MVAERSPFCAPPQSPYRSGGRKCRLQHPIRRRLPTVQPPTMITKLDQNPLSDFNWR